MPVPGRPPVPPRRPAGRLRTALVLPLALLLALVWLPGRAAAADPTVSGGRLDWGIKQSFLTYVTGPIANGKWALTGGAATVGGSVFRFHSATGSYDPSTGALSAAFQGGVRFTGHQENGSNALDLAISHLTVKATAGGDAALYADVSSKSRESGKTSSTSQARLAELSLSGVSLKNATGTITLSNVPATLTSTGASAFGGFYTAGTALDPLTFSVTLKSPAAAPSPTPTPSAAPSETAADPAPSATATGTATNTATAFDRGALDWGVRRTFRDYVTGSIAQGGWQLGDGAADGGAFFRWTPARGSWDQDARTLDAAFAGTVRFTGLREGDALGLDLTLANPRLTATGAEGHLTVDVSGRTPDGATRTATATEIATFDASALRTENGLLTATDLPLALTSAGASAFGNLYPAGTEMDPLTVSLPLTADAAVPPLPDLGAAPTPTPSAGPVTTTPTAAAASSSPSTALVTTLVLALAAAAAAVTTFVVRRRRRS
ncbi:HtaA domain-containing protein [Kitasatospora sp. NA04385]|uniref:HtaA domain-containing protein n=1 Tax=Kitasatospora sp. NA04385 TaxID=2742135 RepID=UPI0015900FFD|nr:HtaA domain-containing protein [Kitasatospora sp. NA04385]QKW23568.1 HtaA domain-containing protein [Kitasatospora sp. NA04385]